MVPANLDPLDVLTLVSAGVGVTLMPTSTRHLHPEGLAFVSLRGRPTSSMVLAWRPPDSSPALRAFVELARRGRPGRR